MKSEVIAVSSKGRGMDAALAQADSTAQQMALSHRDAVHMHLLVEEMMSMVRSIIGQLEEFYGHELPTKLYPDYVPDEIDAVDADYKVAMPIYGGFGLGDTKNTHLPAMFFAVGAKDHLMLNPALGRHSFGRFFEMMKEHPEIDLELHVFADTPHGFGTARGEDKDIHDHMGTVGTDRWIELAEDFMMVNFGIIDRHYAMGHRPGLGF